LSGSRAGRAKNALDLRALIRRRLESSAIGGGRAYLFARCKRMATVAEAVAIIDTICGAIVVETRCRDPLTTTGQVARARVAHATAAAHGPHPAVGTIGSVVAYGRIGICGSIIAAVVLRVLTGIRADDFALPAIATVAAVYAFVARRRIASIFADAVGWRVAIVAAEVTRTTIGTVGCKRARSRLRSGTTVVTRAVVNGRG
jgi:hypothetical protein